MMRLKVEEAQERLAEIIELAKLGHNVEIEDNGWLIRLEQV